MRKLITLVLLSMLFSPVLMAQTGTDDYVLPKKKEGAMDKVSASVSTGTGVSFSNASKNAAFSSFVAPQIGYQLSSKWKLNVGMMHSTVSANPSFMNATDYNHRNQALQGNFNAAAFGLEYKISDKSSIGISTTIGNGNSNGFPVMNSFSNSMYPLGMFSSFGR